MAEIRTDREQSVPEKKAAPTAAQLKKRNTLRRALLRSAIQLFFFLAMPGAFVAGFSGIKYIFRQISTGSVISWNSFLMALVGLSVFTILFGRFFCGYCCAFGSMGDFIYWISGLIQKKLFHRKKQIMIPEKVSRYLRLLKYLNLIFIIVFTTFGLYSKLSGTSAWDVFSQLTALRWMGAGYLTGILSLAAIIIGTAFKERFFCRFLCPMGAFFSLLPILPFGMLRRKSENCIKGCRACQSQCPMGLKLEADGFLNGECIGCEKCVPVCPKSNISHIEKKFLKNDSIGILIRAALFFALGAWMGLCRFL